MLQETVKIEMGGVELTLLREKAIWIEQQQMLILSDVHLGKLEHLRKNGVAVPIVSNDLVRMDQLIRQFHPQKMVFLGDLFHSSMNSSAQRFRNWRNLHAQVEMQLIEGNHDILSDADYHFLGIEKTEQIILDGLTLRHHPEENPGTPTICGHVHPGVLLQGSGRQSVKLSCFYRAGNLLILPAFGSTTGLFTVRPSEDSEVYAITPSGIACYTSGKKI